MVVAGPPKKLGGITSPMMPISKPRKLARSGTAPVIEAGERETFAGANMGRRRELVFDPAAWRHRRNEAAGDWYFASPERSEGDQISRNSDSIRVYIKYRCIFNWYFSKIFSLVFLLFILNQVLSS
jgi:hypothetical protein